MSWYVYMVQCKNGSLYTGYTTDVQKRLDQHNGLAPGGAKYTRMHRPVILAYTERCASKSGAMRREHEIKAMSHSEKRELVERSAGTAG